jgi:hypothetical protein
LELEGQSYCPVMWGIETLVAATVRFHRMMIDADEYRALLAWRESFAMRPEQAPGQYESLRVICPAEGEDRLMSCGEKPTSLDRGLPKMPSRPHQGLEVCTTESVTISGTSGAKVHWSSSGDSGEWHGCYATMRWIAETRFDQRIEAIRRPAKGIAAQSLYIAFIVFWENVRQLRRFIAEAETSSDGTTVDADEENLDY